MTGVQTCALPIFECTFPVHTPSIARIEVVTRGDVRRAKLYYLRNLHGKAAKIKELRED